MTIISGEDKRSRNMDRVKKLKPASPVRRPPVNEPVRLQTNNLVTPPVRLRIKIPVTRQLDSPVRRIANNPVNSPVRKQANNQVRPLVNNPVRTLVYNPVRGRPLFNNQVRPQVKNNNNNNAVRRPVNYPAVAGPQLNRNAVRRPAGNNFGGRLVNNNQARRPPNHLVRWNP